MIETPGDQPSSVTRNDSQQKDAASQVLDVARPQPGELRIVDLDRSTEVAFGFNLDEARIIALDVDIIIAFSDGGKLLLPNLGLLATGDHPPAVRFASRGFTWEQVLSTVTDVAIGESTATLSNIDRTSNTAGKAPDPSDARSTPVVESTPAAPAPAPLARAKAAPTPDPDLQAGAVGEPIAIKSTPLELPKPVVVSSGSATRFADPNQNGGYYVAAGLNVSLSVSLKNDPVATPEIHNLDGSQTVYFAPGAFGSDTDFSYAAQAASRQQPVAATNKGDTFFLDDPTKIPAGYAYRTLSVTLDSQTQGFEVLTIAVSGLPKGARILGYEASNGVYQIPVDGKGSGKVDIGLIYALPQDDAVKDADGFYQRFQLTVRSTATNVQGDFRETSAVVRFGVRDVEAEADSRFADAKGSVAVLWANPPGAAAVGGAGDDTFYSGAGADTFTSGGGSDLVSYKYSSRAVSIDLESRTHSANLVGDVFIDDFAKVEGSAFADSIAGNAKDNLFLTSGGADTIDGRAGSDTVDFSSSTIGVTVDLGGANAQSGGLAEGVVLRNVENIVGSKTGANYFVGTDADNRFVGGDTNDTFIGSAGQDSYIGGAGYNILDYSGLTVGLSLDMQSGPIYLQNIGKIVGSAFGDTLLGDGADNYLLGGGSGDSLMGRGGADTLDGGGGNDTFRDDGASDTYLGGAGDDLFIAGASFVPGLHYDGGADFDVVDFSAFAPTTQKFLTAVLLPDGSGRVDWPGSALIGNFLNMEGVIGGKLTQDSLIGNDSDNLLIGGDLADTIVGMGGRDTISGGGGGGDCLIGGGDGDTIDYSRASSGVTLTVSGPTYTAQVGNSVDTLSGFQDIIGSSFNDRIYADGAARSIFAGAGDDTISPGLGEDTIDGGDGVDLVDLGYLGAAGLSIDLRTPGAPVLGNGQHLYLVNTEGVIGTSGADTIVADPARPGYIATGGGDDSIVAGAGGGETIDGGGGLDAADFSAGTVGLSVNLANGSLSASDTGGRSGLIGNIEVLLGGSGADTIAAVGDSVAHTFSGNLGDDSLVGGALNDSLSGGQGDDILVGGAGDDTLSASVGDDTTDGGSGTADVITYADRSVGVSVVFDSASLATVTVSATETDMMINAENVFGGLYGDTIVATDAVAHKFSGDRGDDCLSGGSGSDTLSGGAGWDTIFGQARGVAGDAGDVLDYSYTNGSSTPVSGLTYDMASAAAALSGMSVSVAAGDIDFVGYFQNIVGTSGNDRIVTDANNNLLWLGAGDDTVVGGAAGDRYDGGSGGDWLDLSGSAQNISVLIGEAAATATVVAGGVRGVAFTNFEAFVGGAGADTITGNSVSNTLAGGAGNDRLDGGAGDDSLSAGSGADTIDGGAGIDAVSFDGATAGVTVTLSSSATVTTTIGTQRGRLSNVELVMGSTFNDAIVGSALNETLSGGLGDDTLTGGGGANSISGGLGNDLIYLSPTAGLNDTIDGGDGIDTLDLSRFSTGVSVKLNRDGTGYAIVGGRTIVLVNIENVTGGSGNDTLVGDEGPNLLQGGAGNDSLAGGPGDDTLYGGSGDDTLRGSEGVNLLDPGTGADSITNDDLTSGLAQIVLPVTPKYSGTGYDDTLVAGTDSSGASASFTLSGEGGSDSLIGGSLNDYLSGGAGNDTLFGLGGQDTLDAGFGNDQLDGGQGGFDLATYADRTTGIRAVFDSANVATVSVDAAGGETDTIVNIEWIAGGSGNDTIGALDAVDHGFAGNAGDDSLFGGGGNDTLWAGAGANTLLGGLGDDRLYAGGNDTLDGGAGTDTLDLSALNGAFVTIDATGKTHIVAAGSVASDGVNFEMLVGGAGNDTVAGGLAAIIVDSDGGDDCLVGGAGDDTLFGGSGNDTFVGGAGANRLDGGALGVDVVDYSSSTAALSVTLLAPTIAMNVTLTSGSVDTIINIEGLIASAFNDTILAGGADTTSHAFSGLGGADSLVGALGNDTLDGGSGADTLVGAAGNDYYYADSTDSLTEAAGGGTDTIGARETFFNLGGAQLAGAQIENLEYVGAGGDFTGLGNGLANLITGGAGSDSLSGLIGLDTLLGGLGNDTLDGGADADSLSGAAGDDCLIGGAGNDVVDGGLGADTLDGGAGPNTLIGGAGNDLYIVANATDRLVEAAGGGVDTVQTALTTLALANAATLYNGVASGYVENLVYTGAGNFSGVGNDVDNSISGGSGADTLMGGLGNDTLNGGAGLDAARYSYGGAPTLLVASDQSLANGVHTFKLSGNAEVDTLVNIETLLMGFSSFTVDLSALGDSGSVLRIDGSGGSKESFVGSAGADSFVGSANSGDTFSGGLGNDTMNGGSGVDMVDYSYVKSTTNTFTLTRATDTSWTGTAAVGADVDSLIAMEGVKLGAGVNTVSLAAQTGAVTIDGSLGASNFIVTGAGNDSLVGGANADTLTGGAGANTMAGGAGDDLYIVGGSADRVLEAATGGVDTVQTALASLALGSINDTTAGMGSCVENLVYTGAASFTGAGNELANSIIGGGSSDTLSGGAGDDTLSGGMLSTTNRVSADISNFTNINLGFSWFGSGATTTTIDPTIAAALGRDPASKMLEVTYSWTPTALFGSRAVFGNTTTTVGATYVDTYVVKASDVSESTWVQFASNGLGNNNASADSNFWVNVNLADGSIGQIGSSLHYGDISVAQIGTTGWYRISISGTSGGGASMLIKTIDKDIANGAAATSTGTQTIYIAAETLVQGDGADSLDGGSGNDNLKGLLGNDTLSGGAGADTLDGGAGRDVADYSYLAAGSTQNVVSSADGLTFTVNSGTASGDADIDTLLNVEVLKLGAGVNTVDLSGNTTAQAFTLDGSAGATDSLRGSGGGDSLRGGAGKDTLFGMLGADTLSGGGGNDVLDGGAGSDTADYSYLAAGSTQSVAVSANGLTFTVNSGGADVDTLFNIESFKLGAGDNSVNLSTSTTALGFTIDGSASATNWMLGGSGRDSFLGGLGRDTLSGGLGNDTLNGGSSIPGDASLDWADYSYVGNGNALTNGVTVTLNGAGGTATVSVGVDVDRLINLENVAGSQFADSITGDAVNNYLVGGLGADTIDGGGGNDTLDGNGSGGADPGVIDIVSFNSAAAGVDITLDLNNLNGGAPYAFSLGGSSTSVDYLSNFEGVIGGAGADSLVGDAQANYLGGGAGNDTLSGGAGANTLDGGAGVDVVNYSRVTNDMTVLLNNLGKVLLNGSYGTDAFSDTLQNIEGVVTGSGNDSVLGDTTSNFVLLGAGNDTVQGSLGDDTLDGGSGADVVNFAYLDTRAAQGVSLQLGALVTYTTGQTVAGASDTDVLVNIEGAIGTNYGDTLIGYSAGGAFDGRGGDDSIVGGSGADTIVGGAGNDALDGGAGNGDVADYSYVSTGLSITLDATGGASVSVSATESDTLANFEGVIGGSGADVLSGNASANFLSGGLGADTLFGGGAGDDTLFGGAGNDMILFGRTAFAGMNIDGGAGTDTVRFQASGSYNGADLSVAITNVEVLDFRTTGADVSVALSGAEIAKMAGLNGGSRDLTILTSASGGDAVSITDNAANVVSSVNGGTTDYTIYDKDANDPTKTVLAILHVTPG